MHQRLDEDNMTAVEWKERATGAGVVFDEFLGRYVFNWVLKDV